jgi:hypothetical protein
MVTFLQEKLNNYWEKGESFWQNGTWISLAINGWALLLVYWANGSGFSCLQTIRWFVKGKEVIRTFCQYPFLAF